MRKGSVHAGFGSLSLAAISRGLAAIACFDRGVVRGNLRAPSCVFQLISVAYCPVN